MMSQKVITIDKQFMYKKVKKVFKGRYYITFEEFLKNYILLFGRVAKIEYPKGLKNPDTLIIELDSNNELFSKIEYIIPLMIAMEISCKYNGIVIYNEFFEINRYLLWMTSKMQANIRWSIYAYKNDIISGLLWVSEDRRTLFAKVYWKEIMLYYEE